MALDVTVEDVKAWKAAVETVGTVIQEGVFTFSEDGVTMKAMDPSQVVFVSFYAPAAFFSKYSIGAPEIKLPLNVDEYNRIISRASADDVIHMSLRDGSLVISMEAGDVAREFSIPLVDVPEQVLPAPPERGGGIEVSAKALREAIKDASLFSTTVTFIARANTLVVEARGASGHSRTALPFAGQMDEAVARYSIPYLQNILKGAESDVRISFATDSYLQLSYAVGGITLTFFLAHIIL